MNLKTLKQIFAELSFDHSPAQLPDVPISGIAIDSRAVKPGYLFVAMKGGSADGHDYIQSAIQNGAAAIVGENELSGLAVPYVRLENSRQALTWIAGAFYDWPGRKLTMIGVTGTDGKTTTTNLIYQILLAANIKAGMISTVNAVIGGEVLDTGLHVTTPDAHDVQYYLAKMVEAGLTHVVLETTSHGWAQYRTDACEFDVGVITNITHEHLDQHGSYENYRAAKGRLFASLETTLPKKQGNPRLAVLNRDDRSYEYLDAITKVKKVSYGLGGNADVHAERIEYSPSGLQFEAALNSLRVAIKSKLIGEYNISNCLAALTATVIGLGIEPEIAAQGIASLEGVPGRMERIDMGQSFTAIVDFAHTPNALKVTLEAAREMLSSSTAKSAKAAKKEPNLGVLDELRGSEKQSETSRVIVVFGSAGLRDKEKRRMMAETSTELADLTVLTAEDPRTESLDGILKEMAAGARSRGGREGETFWRVADRGEAIKFALSLAHPGDIVLSCGKGHEQSMCFGKIEYAWDDRVAMRAALAELLHVEGPKMPYLPTQDKTEVEWLK
ncbi:MAG: UDP-N-acetylmuramoyl-L-alanyl-D-glutamate--2,6-diaminopimelate ligase [Chloroflexi bacterium]|nr:UDP-N-acetylmuramoyl-L-alanyl-D-glutamate--2,6-diaminopimelate ligase [Chloroflexota bacterium]